MLKNSHLSCRVLPSAEEGTYGALPRDPPGPPPPPPGYRPRERKPKVYSSYAVDNADCNVHGKKLAEAEKDHGGAAINRPR